MIAIQELSKNVPIDRGILQVKLRRMDSTWTNPLKLQEFMFLTPRGIKA